MMKHRGFKPLPQSSSGEKKTGQYMRVSVEMFAFFSFFIGKQQKLDAFPPPRGRLGACCLTILIYFKCFKGATSPRHTYVPRL